MESRGFFVVASGLSLWPPQCEYGALIRRRKKPDFPKFQVFFFNPRLEWFYSGYNSFVRVTTNYETLPTNNYFILIQNVNASISHCLLVMDAIRWGSEHNDFTVSHNRSSTASRLLKISFRKPFSRTSSHIISMGFWIVNTSSDSFYKEHVVLNSTGVL